MIIKSMSRAKPSFSQLVFYMEKSNKDSEYNIYNHFFEKDTKGVIQTFEENGKRITKRKNGVYIYHEILSLTKSKNLSDKDIKLRLREIAFEYVQNRAKNNLVYGVIHNENKDNIHYHLMISSNEKGSQKKTRLSKQNFDEIKKNLEKNVLEKYPELEQKKVINKQAERKLSNKGAELKRRTGKTPQREEVVNKLKQTFSNTSNKQEFFDNLTKNNLEIYLRGKTIGFLDKTNNRKHRLKTLGLEKEFEEMSDKISLKNTEYQQTKDFDKKAHKDKKAKTKKENDKFTKEEKALNELKQHRKSINQKNTKTKKKI
jgi:hypothetical protein